MLQREYDVMGRRLQIHLGDITRLEVGAIVSSENADLIMDAANGSSVSSAIRAAEGEGLARTLAGMGPIEPGRAVLTPASALPCQWIIHAATVVKTEQGHDSSLRVIRESVRSALRLAAGLGLESVAFPAFGVRATDISRDQASQAMVEELVTGLTERTSLRRVVVALLDAESFLAFFEEAMKRAARANQPLELRVARHGQGLEFGVHRDGPLSHTALSEDTGAAEASVRATVGRLRSVAERRLLDAPAELKALGGQLASLVPAPIAAEISAESGRPLLLNLDAELADLPFELIHDAGGFLCQRRPVSRLLVSRSPAGSEAPPPQRSVDPSPRTDGHTTVLLVGGAHAALPHGARELEVLGDLLWRRAHMRARVTTLADRRARRERVLAALPEVDLLHWCGHTRPDASWELAADEALSPSDVSGLALRARLVVANSCGAERGSDMARALLMAGAGGVLGTLWDVDDALSLSFSIQLYEELLAGRTVSAALASARERVAGEDPLHWASYVHYGRPDVRIFEPHAR